MILTPPHSENRLITDLLDEAGIAFARIGSVEQAPGIAISMDEEGAAATATDFLAELGHRRIAFIAGSHEYSLSARRVKGWKDAMDRLGLADNELLAQGDFSYESGVEASRRLLDHANPPTAIIASNDRMALAGLDVAAERGIDVPSQLSLVSFDNTPVIRFTRPAFTAIDQPVADTAALAMETIIRSLRGEDLPKQPLVVQASLVERQSTAPAPSVF